SFPFISSKGMESMVSAVDAAPVEFGPPTFEPVDFEHPTAPPTQSATSSALLIKVPGAWLDTGRLNSFERDFIFAFLPFIGQRTLLPVIIFFTPPKTVWAICLIALSDLESNQERGASKQLAPGAPYTHLLTDLKMLREKKKERRRCAQSRLKYSLASQTTKIKSCPPIKARVTPSGFSLALSATFSRGDVCPSHSQSLKSAFFLPSGAPEMI